MGFFQHLVVFALAVLAFGTAVEIVQGHHKGGGGTPGKGKGGDMPTSPFNYVMAYSWTPGFCKGQTYPGCSSPDLESYWTNHFTIHGLWPQYNTTTGYPQDCTTEPFSQTAVDQVGENKMIEYWPNVQEAIGSANYPSFWTHEWSKHGTCSGLPQTEYYNSAINVLLQLGTPSLVTNNVGKTVSAADLRTAFGGSSYVALQCADGNTLTGAFTCWNQQSDVPTMQVPCVGEVTGEDNCNAADGQIIIPSLASTTHGPRGSF